MNRTKNYKTLMGCLRQTRAPYLSLDNIICDRFQHKTKGWCKFNLSTNALKDFVCGICRALNMRDKEIVYYNLLNHRVESCGILERVVVMIHKNKPYFQYYAGQDYLSETRLVRKLLRCK